MDRRAASSLEKSQNLQYVILTKVFYRPTLYENKNIKLAYSPQLFKFTLSVSSCSSIGFHTKILNYGMILLDEEINVRKKDIYILLIYSSIAIASIIILAHAPYVLTSPLLWFSILFYSLTGGNIYIGIALILAIFVFLPFLIEFLKKKLKR